MSAYHHTLSVVITPALGKLVMKSVVCTNNGTEMFAAGGDRAAPRCCLLLLRSGCFLLCLSSSRYFRSSFWTKCFLKRNVDTHPLNETPVHRVLCDHDRHELGSPSRGDCLSSHHP